MLLGYHELSECREIAAAAANTHEISRGVHPVRGVGETFRLVARLQRHVAADHRTTVSVQGAAMGPKATCFPSLSKQLTRNCITHLSVDFRLCLRLKTQRVLTQMRLLPLGIVLGNFQASQQPLLHEHPTFVIGELFP